MDAKKILSQLNFIGQCRRYGISLWQCPGFLFIVMGAIIVFAMIGAYFVGSRYSDDPEVAALITILVTIILLIIGYIITSSFERLAEISRMKSEFVSIVSHQLRTPLSSMNWIVQFILSRQSKEFSSEQLENISIIKENIRRMNKLINDFLNVTRIEQGKFELFPEKFLLSEFIKGVVKDFDIFAKSNNVSIGVEVPENLFAFADQAKIRLVLENFLDNAIRYIEKSGKVTVRAFSRQDLVRVEVSDTGVGVAEGEQKYIFGKFFRSRDVMRNQTEGSGLGLYIAKGIIEKSGGKVGFKSEQGKGSTFWFTLPKPKV